MSTTKIRGIIKEVSEVSTYGTNNEFRKQTIVIFKPGYVDPMTKEQKYPDEDWGVDVFNDNIEKINVSADSVNTIIEVNLRLRGRSYDRKDGKGKGYNITGTVKEATFHGKAHTSF